MMKIAKLILRWFFALMFITAGVMHFVIPEFFVRIMPPVFPYPLFWVYLSGVFEIVLGMMLIIPRCTRTAAWGLIVLLVLVFPANVYMAMNPQIFTEYSLAKLYLRLPLQLVLIAVVYWFTKEENR